ncbi:MAG: hypothetical protein WBE42_24780 [Pseudolabrys sp.]|jgi:hypothetical protein
MSNLRELTDREVDIVNGGWRIPFLGNYSSGNYSSGNNSVFINVGNTVGAQIGQQNNILSLVGNGAGVQLGSLGL